MSPMLLACGFCLAGPSLLLLPWLPVCAGTFLVWCGFLKKYDPGQGPSPRRWLITGCVVGVVGAILSIELWSLGIAAWLAYVASRVVRLRAPALVPAPTAPEGLAAAQDASPSARALRFHTGILLLLAAGLTARLALHALGWEYRL